MSRRMDARLERRHRVMVEAASLRPAASFPLIFPDRKSLEGAYDLFANENVEPSNLLRAHIEETVQRCESAGDILVISDTTDVMFGGTKRRGLGKVGSGGQGFLMHCSIAISATDTRRVLGVLDAQFWVRSAETREQRGMSRSQIQDDEQNEFRVWSHGMKASELALGGRARAVHVGDRGADGFGLLAELDELGMPAVIRCKHDRTTFDGESKTKLSEKVAAAEMLVEREVPLSSRRKSPFPKGHSARAARLAQLRISATPITIHRPSRASRQLPKELSLTAVHVVEQNAPSGTEPVEWVLWTNLDVRDATDAARVVDIYRARWVIEELFKALKTGCGVEARQLETGHSLMNMTAFYLPIAAKILSLRGTAREIPDAPATQVCTKRELEVLRRISPLSMPSTPTVKDALDAVAKLGGHLKSNGEPGWQVLGRGWLRLVEFMELQERFADADRSPES